MSHPLSRFLMPRVRSLRAAPGELSWPRFAARGVRLPAADGAQAPPESRAAQEALRDWLEGMGVPLRDDGLPLRLRTAPSRDGPESYALALDPGGIVLAAAARDGFLRAAATLLQCLQGLETLGTMPSAVVEDAPLMRRRGIFVEDKWGPDLMEPDDWRRVVDLLALRRMNVLMVGLYGCWNVQYDGQVTEFLMTPVPGRPELETRRAVRWLPARAAADAPCPAPREIRYAPVLFEKDFLGDLVAYGAGRGVAVIPVPNSLGHNTLFPRLLPAVSAKREDGTPTGYGYCLSSRETWDFVSGWYGSIVDRCLKPHGADSFHLGLDEIYPVRGADPSDPLRLVDPDCRCPACRAVPFGRRIQDWVLRLAVFLRDKGMRNVVLWNDQLTRHMDLLDAGFLARLEKEGLRDRLVLHWWWYDNDGIHEKVHPSLGKGLRSWVAPIASYYGWAWFQTCRPNIGNMLRMGHAEGSEGGVSYSIHEPANDLDYALLADGTWSKPLGEADGPALWAEGLFPGEGAALREAVEALDAASSNPLARRIYYYTYTYPREGLSYPRRFPEEALQALEQPESHAAEGLELMAGGAARAEALFGGLLDKAAGGNEAAAAPLSARARRLEVLRALRAEAVRARMTAEAFRELLRIRGALAAGSGAPLRDIAARAASASWRYEEAMRPVEEGKPDFLAPSTLRDLSVLSEFLRQLASDMGEAAAGRRAPAGVRWHVRPCIAQRGGPWA